MFGQKIFFVNQKFHPRERNWANMFFAKKKCGSQKLFGPTKNLGLKLSAKKKLREIFFANIFCLAKQKILARFFSSLVKKNLNQNNQVF